MYTTINKSTDYFNTKLYTGNGGTNAITGLNFEPSLVWIKKRASEAGDHGLYDAVRGVLQRLQSNENSAEATTADSLTAFGTDGFTMGSNSSYNGNSKTYVSWNWKANGAGSTNYDGSINSTVSANQTAGFSIVSYTGNGTSGATVGHGLGSVPKFVMVKTRSGSGNWINYHSSVGNTKYLSLNQTNSAGTTNQAWNDTSPTNQVFSLGNSSEVNGNGTTMIAYCFAENASKLFKIGSYVGNGSNNGTFIYTGGKPVWIILKNANRGEDWLLFDNKRDIDNLVHSRLSANTNNTDYNGDSNGLDFLSNGFKIRTSSSAWNYSGENFIYMAINQPIVGQNNTPCTAR